MPDIVSEVTNMPNHIKHPSIETQCEAMRHTLTEAAKRANHLRRPVVASYTLAVATVDPLDVFAGPEASAAAQAWYWEQPSRGLAVAAFSVAAEWQSRMDGPHPSVAAWRELLADAVFARDEQLLDAAPSQPLGFGGFAFDDGAAKTALWQDFPGASLTMPEAVVTHDGTSTTLTLTASVRPEDGVDQPLARWHEHTSRLLESRAALHDLSATSRELSLHEVLPEREWEQMVAKATHEIGRGALDKIVLARAVEGVSERTFDTVAALQRLRAEYPTATTFAARRGDQTFLGATPERLAKVRRGQVETIALAGTAPRGATPEDDAHAAEALRRSEKNAGEHAVVVTSIREVLAPLCGAVEIERSPHIRTLPNVLHLETSISGELLPDRSLLDVVAALHPTPAVAGFPRQDALAYLREHERLDRGWYAGALGWVDAEGEGEFVVALRSALVEGTKATLFAGCGIVADSQPEAEYAESKLKLRVMLEALGASDGEE